MGDALDDILFGIVDFGEGADTKIVLVQDNDKPGRPPKYKCPGGRSEFGDQSNESALVREVLEELGIRCTPQAEVYRRNHTDHSVAWWATKPLDNADTMHPGKEIAIIHVVDKEECLSLIGKGDVLEAHAAALAEYLDRYTF
jgi:8-oxo-dGTP pyrophosphatase MutT (NUDIX family)